ncbi:MAG: hypothetical protein AAF938_06495 [Myxococcota bacterium]
MSRLYTHLRTFIDRLCAHPNVHVMRYDIVPPRPLDPAIAAKLPGELVEFFEAVSEVKFWWFAQNEMEHENPLDYLPGALGGYVHLKPPALPRLVIDHLGLSKSVTRLDRTYGYSLVHEEMPPEGFALEHVMGDLNRYLRIGCQSVFTAGWQLPLGRGEDSPAEYMRRALLPKGNQKRFEDLACPFDNDDFRHFERTPSDRGALVQELIAGGMSDIDAASMVDWLGDDATLLVFDASPAGLHPKTGVRARFTLESATDSAATYAIEVLLPDTKLEGRGTVPAEGPPDVALPDAAPAITVRTMLFSAQDSIRLSQRWPLQLLRWRAEAN